MHLRSLSQNRPIQAVNLAHLNEILTVFAQLLTTIEIFRRVIGVDILNFEEKGGGDNA